MRKTLAIAIITLLGSTAFAAGEIYRWKGTDGTWHYSDQYRPGAETVRGPTSATSNSTPPAQASAPAAAPAPTTNDPLPVSKETAEEVRQEASTAKAKRCEKSKADYERMVQARRITNTDAKGNVTFLDAAGMDKARLDARAARDLDCAP